MPDIDWVIVDRVMRGRPVSRIPSHDERILIAQRILKVEPDVSLERISRACRMHITDAGKLIEEARIRPPVNCSVNVGPWTGTPTRFLQ